jgi:hypothetical protein
MMLSNMKDEHIAALLRVAKTNKALRPFFGTPKGMILLRQEANRRGIYGGMFEADAVVKGVFFQMEDRRDERKPAAE